LSEVKVMGSQGGERGSKVMAIVKVKESREKVKGRASRASLAWGWASRVMVKAMESRVMVSAQVKAMASKERESRAKVTFQGWVRASRVSQVKEMASRVMVSRVKATLERVKGTCRCRCCCCCCRLTSQGGLRTRSPAGTEQAEGGS
jgi:hypothetical protein